MGRRRGAGKQPARATSQDVADRAGVSRSAVSLVLNGRGAGNIAEDKQAAIRRAARELNYSPNSVALSLRNQRTRTIGLVTDEIATSAFGGKLLRGATDTAIAAGYLLLVIDTQGDVGQEEQAYELLLDRRVDALIFAAMSMHPHPASPAMINIASVLANCYEPDGRLPSVCADEVEGGRTAARILLDQGHRDIRLLAGTTDVDAARLRIDGYRTALAEAGAPVPEPVTAGWTIEAGYAAAMQVLDRPDRPTGVLCANDRCAVGVALAAAQLGLSVPEDLSIVGYDDDENIAPAMHPLLTTVQLPHRAIGETATRLLLDHLADPAAPSAAPLLLPCPPVLRDSVAPPRP
ncbi:LacI family DNA-binding transcriptional regulator [Microlunatus speluncae]|uniref:LacI family DNA-binding transcriptional regulator n=1 Tax=Microlunatus speluncae TaxID=2594267 RepID=UPI001266554E|nr:LacI family DNA-binding transcriptional regulator [Microlunatus speluncae]